MISLAAFVIVDSSALVTVVVTGFLPCGERE
jgi:hypothetical protein